MKPADPLLTKLLDNLTTAILLIGPDRTLRYLNPAAEMLLDVSFGRMGGAPITELFTEGGKPLAGVTNARETGNPYTKRQATLQLASGNRIVVDYAVTPIEDRGGRSLLMELQPLDRLLRISREETILSAQQTTRKLIRGLAHEIKNPLGGIRGAAQLLAKELPSDNLRDYTDIIIAETDRLRKLVDQLLGPHKLPETRPINIHEVAERVAGLIEAETAGRVRIQRDYDPSIPPLVGDKEQLIQAMLNIMRNAMQALGETPEPSIRISTRVLRKFTIGRYRHRLVCRLDIEDNGPGIPEELLQNIFFPMVSGRPTGTGLGLSIAQAIINQHQGLIECTSEPGHTCFSLYIPLEPIHEDTE